MWVAILTGLGFGTIERAAGQLMQCLEKHSVPKATWMLASSFLSPLIEVPNYQWNEGWKNMLKAVTEARENPVEDLRYKCLSQSKKKIDLPQCSSLEEMSSLLAALAPIPGATIEEQSFSPEYSISGEADVFQVAKVSEALSSLNATEAIKFIDALGGEAVVLEWFCNQIPWVTQPFIKEDGKHGRTVFCNLIYVGDDQNLNMEKRCGELCELLLWLTPSCEAAEVEGVTALGTPMEVNGFNPNHKNIPRRNVYPEPIVSWNVAFGQIFRNKTTSTSLSEFSLEMADLLERTEKVFRSYSEKWISSHLISSRDDIAKESTEIMQAARDLSFSERSTPEYALARDMKKGGLMEKDNTVGAVITNILGNLMPRMGKSAKEDTLKARAAYAGDIAEDLQKHLNSSMWRTVKKPPIRKLAAIGSRLRDVSHILHEMSFDESPSARLRYARMAKKGGLGKKVSACARYCEANAMSRLRSKMRRLESDLRNLDVTAKCYLKREISDLMSSISATRVPTTSSPQTEKTGKFLRIIWKWTGQSSRGPVRSFPCSGQLFSFFKVCRLPGASFWPGTLRVSCMPGADAR